MLRDAFGAMFALLLCGGAFAAPLPSAQISQHILEQCEEQAMPYGAYDPIIADSAKQLIDLGVFTPGEFHDLHIGFCGMRRINGPVATTSCSLDTILLDEKYKNKSEGLVLHSTLAHEIKHYFQHKDRKAQFGENYCFSKRYLADHPQLEEEADKFGDNVAALLFIGRPVEIKNNCPVSVTVFLEPDKLSAANRNYDGFIDVAAQSSVLTPWRSVTKDFKSYAQSEVYQGRRWTWGGDARAPKRNINGESYRLKRISLSNRSRSTGPFIMELSCS